MNAGALKMSHTDGDVCANMRETVAALKIEIEERTQSLHLYEKMLQDACQHVGHIQTLPKDPNRSWDPLIYHCTFCNLKGTCHNNKALYKKYSEQQKLELETLIKKIEGGFARFWEIVARQKETKSP